MKNAYKIIITGLATLLASCSNDASTAGATTEPNTSQTANLTEEQKIVLARAINIATDTTKRIPDSSAVETTKYYNFFGSEDNQVSSYPSKDGRRTCDVVSFTNSAKYDGENEGEGVFKAMAYDEQERTCWDYEDNVYVRRPCSTGVYLWDHNTQTLVGTKIMKVDSVPVVLKLMDAANWSGETYWGYGTTCTETLEKFKQSCSESNGLFKDLADGCRDSYLRLACASFIPEGETAEALLENYTQEYKNECIDDSIKYAPVDDENYVPRDRRSDSLYRADTLEKMITAELWIRELKQSLNGYRWQFTIFNVRYDDYNNLEYDEIEDIDLPESKWRFLSSWYSYNTLPDTDIAKAYRKEGVYVLPDSLVENFFPLAASVPYGLRYADGEHFGSKKDDIFYMIVVKDVGTKGHILNNSDANGIYVTDIVKSGVSCPTDTTVHYATFLVVNSPEWDVLDKPIVKTTLVSENWNCDKPETLEKIEPYGEWAFSGVYGYHNYLELFLDEDSKEDLEEE